MNRIVNIALLAVMFMFCSCSEDIHPEPALAGPLYGLSKGEPGSVDELIYNTWEFCGVYYLYDYSKYAFQLTNWSSMSQKWYTPVREEYKEIIKDVINIIQGEVFVGMDGDFIRRNWYVRVFLCDSLCDAYDYDESKLVDYYMENEDLLIIPNVGEVMKNYTEQDWQNWKEQFSNLLISRLYLGATEEPTAFFDLRYKDPKTGKEAIGIWATDWVDDPENKYSPNMYTFRSRGYWRSKSTSLQPESVLIVDRKADVADYITHLTTLPGTELEYIWERFPVMLERTRAIVPYLEDILGLDLVSMHNANCPADPVEADYFKDLCE